MIMSPTFPENFRKIPTLNFEKFEFKYFSEIKFNLMYLGFLLYCPIEICVNDIVVAVFPFDALTRLVGWQEGYLACKKAVCWFVGGDELTGILQLSPPSPSSLALVSYTVLSGTLNSSIPYHTIPSLAPIKSRMESNPGPPGIMAVIMDRKRLLLLLQSNQRCVELTSGCGFIALPHTLQVSQCSVWCACSSWLC